MRIDLRRHQCRLAPGTLAHREFSNASALRSRPTRGCSGEASANWEQPTKTLSASSAPGTSRRPAWGQPSHPRQPGAPLFAGPGSAGCPDWSSASCCSVPPPASTPCTTAGRNCLTFLLGPSVGSGRDAAGCSDRFPRSALVLPTPHGDPSTLSHGVRHPPDVLEHDRIFRLPPCV